MHSFIYSFIHIERYFPAAGSPVILSFIRQLHAMIVES